MSDKPHADKSLLFVDDESHILNSLKRLFRKEGFNFFSAPGGEEGLALLADNPDIQMVVTDQRMPGMCGTEFLAEVKKQYPETVRIVLSGFAEASAIVEAINQGEVYRFISKPWTDDDLKYTIHQCLDHYDLLQENKRLNRQSRQQLQQVQELNTMLEASMEERTRSLYFSQEVLDSLPLIVLGISLEEEVILTNGTARKKIDALHTVIPGTGIEDILPDEAVESIRSCLTRTQDEEFHFRWDGLELRARSTPLVAGSSPRGCVLLLEEK